ncbi:MAG TPA: hypothetical protein VFW25_01425 [Silvibacterium sp.]|nr:hypothetical protein [Silvibacterium sp.]
MPLRHSCVRHLSQYSQFAPLYLVLVLLTALPLWAGASQQGTATPAVVGKRIWLRDAQTIAVKHAGPAKLVQALASAQPLALARGDFDADGVEDLIVGYASGNGGILALHHGNVDAFAPQSKESFEAIGRGEFPSPFMPTANLFDLPVRPDFVTVGSLNGEGYPDIIVAQRGGSSIYLLSNNGKGKFAAPKAINVGGPITGMSAGEFGRRGAYSKLLVGISDRRGSYLMVYAGMLNGLGGVTVLPLQATLASIEFADLGDIGPDAVVIAGGQVAILHSSTMRLESLSLPVAAKALVVGSFIYDRNAQLQMAILGSDGSINFAVHNEFDPHSYTVDELREVHRGTLRGSTSALGQRNVPRNGWKIVEAIPGIASSGTTPVLLRARISDNGSDDVMVLNPAGRQMTLIAHPDLAPGDTTFVPGEISFRPYNGSPVAAITMRVNVDGRAGVVSIHQGQIAPSVLMPLPDPTFIVDSTTDAIHPGACAAATPGQCTLREAVIEANSVAGTDTIMVPAGTYTLTLPKVVGDCTAQHGALYINDSVNIVGAGQATTIIEAGSSAGNGIDFVAAVNEDLGTSSCQLTSATASISNLTLKFGTNRGTHGFDGDGGCMEFDTGSSGTANLTLTNVTLDSCSTTKGNGGGIAIFNVTHPGNGLVTITNSIIQNNSSVDTTDGVAATAGGIWVSDPARMLMSNSQVIDNNATQVSNTGTVAGEGGGITVSSKLGNSRQTVIHASTISGNHAGGNGGGIHDQSSLLIDQGTIISNNSAGEANKANGTNGGGLWINPSNNGCPAACTDTATLTKVTITGNTATGNGGGIYHGNGTGAGDLTMSFSRLAANTAPDGSNFFEDHSVANVINNWWGTNTPANTMGNSAGTTTFDPFIELTHTASPSTIKINQSTTLTADMSKDNHGNGATLSGNLDEIVGLPVTFDNPVLGSIPQAQPETLGNPVPTVTATFNAGGTSGHGSADATVDQQSVTAPIVILEPLKITKSFVPATVAINASSALTFSVDNPNVIAVDGSFTDALPANLVVASTPGVTNTCSGTVTAAAGSGTVSFSNASLAAGTCTITVNVASAVDNVYNNSVTINSTAAGTGAQSTSSASLTVINPPSITKAFGAASIPLNGSTSLSFTVSNTNINTTLSGLAFTDSLPAGLIVATPNGLTSTCGGTATAAAGSGSVALAGASLAPGASCTVSANVTGTTAGVKNNSVTVSSTNGGTGNTSNASLTVVGPPTISKAFGAASIPLNGSTSLSFTIQNGNAVALTGVRFSDTLPAGLIISTPNGLTGSCGSGTITATQNTNVISLSGATLAASASCTFSANVMGTAAGVQNNTTSAVSSTEGGTGGTASASITVVAPPSIAKAFNPSTIAVNATTSLTFTITNPAANTAGLAGVAFTDTLPTGLTVANATATVCGGTLTTTAPTGIALSGATIATNSQCQFSVTVTGAASGQFTNTTGSVTSTNGGTGNTASANLTVASPPSITKAFGAASIPLNGTTSLTFNITNPNSGFSLTGVSFTDTLPAGLIVATPNSLSSTCGGTATAVAGSGSVALTNASLSSAASCTVSLNVQGTTAGVKNNTVQVSSTEGGVGNTSNASLTVVGPPIISKAFGAASIPLNGSTSLSFTIQNGNAVALTGVGFSDTLPAGLVISTPNGLTGSCGSGTITSTQGTGTISLSGATLAASASCTFSANVTGASAGLKNNTTSAVSSTEGGTGGTASASLTVVAPPSIAKVFDPSAIALNATTSLTFTITNPSANPAALTGVAFADTLPTGLTVASASATVCGGTLTTTAPTGIALSGATIATDSQCQFSVTVTGAASGQFTNTTGSVTSTNAGTGNTASANLTVASPPSITKAFGAASIPLNGITSLTFNITNPNSGFSLTGVSFTDTLPAGLIVATPNSLSSTCGGTAAATGGAVSLSGATLSGSCIVSVNVQGTSAGVKNNSVTVSSTNAGTGNTANASITVVGPPVITKAFGAASIPLNGSTSLSFTIQNGNAVALTGVGFNDTLPAGLVVSTPNGLTGSCGAGTISAGGGTVSLSGSTLSASASCTFSVNVTGTTAGVKNNTTSAVTSTQGGTGGTASASLTVVAPPSISKAFGAATIAVNGTTSLTLTITNPNTGVALSGVAVADTFPSGLEVAATPAATNGCGGTLTATPSSGSISLSGGTVAASASCTITVNVTAISPGAILNTTGPVTSTNGGTGGTASASVQAGDFTISATPASESIGVGAMASYKITLSSNNGFQGTIQLACSGGPAKSTCTIKPSQVTLVSGSETAKVVIDVTPPKSASKGKSTLTFTATSGRLIHKATVVLVLK